MINVGTFNPENVVGPEWEFEVPKRKILSIEDMDIWQKSEAYFEYLGFISAMNEAVEGKPSTGNYPKSDRIVRLLELLNTVDSLTDEIPPIEQPQRFGNKAFRTWHQRLSEESGKIVMTAVETEFHQAAAEIKEYLKDSFGNPIRIDYGTGHEMAFCMFLCCLFKIGALQQADKEAVVCYVFSRYLDVVRKLQSVYKMEPAGSRGVWALDDYQFIPFIWGSSQLAGHPRLSPAMFVQNDSVQTYANDYMFMGCIKFILQVKSGPFAEHSNQLWNISGVITWEKVNQGLIKMYKAEVLAKFPVIQHVLFGSLLTLKVAERGKGPGAEVPLRMHPPRSSPTVSTLSFTPSTLFPAKPDRDA